MKRCRKKTTDSASIKQVKKYLCLVKKNKTAVAAVLINCYAMRLPLILCC